MQVSSNTCLHLILDAYFASNIRCFPTFTCLSKASNTRCFSTTDPLIFPSESGTLSTQKTPPISILLTRRRHPSLIPLTITNPPSNRPKAGQMKNVKSFTPSRGTLSIQHGATIEKRSKRPSFIPHLLC